MRYAVGMRELSEMGEASSNPFSPGFGRSPRSLVGRDGLLGNLASGLMSGPEDSRYTSVLMGVRGSGKTVALNEIEDGAARSGWVVLSIDAGTPGILERIAHTVYQTVEGYESLELSESYSRRSVERSVGVNLGPIKGKLASVEHFDNASRMGVREHLATLAEAARRAGTSVLLTIDELHSIDRTEARRLSNDLQHITTRARMPLAFVGAGLLEMRYTLMADRKVTFFHRCDQQDMPPLERIDAMEGLRRTIMEAGGSIDNDALQLAAGVVDGSPYKLQVVGHAAWQIAGAPDNSVDLSAAELAVAAADEIVDRNVSVPALYDLSDVEQAALRAIADAGPGATVSAVSTRTGAAYRQAGRIVRRLLLSGYVAQSPSGVISLTGLVPGRVIADQMPPDDADTQWHRPAPAPQQATMCHKWMPRAQARCILTNGHAGGCRSR